MSVLGTIIDEQENPCCRQAIDDAIEHRLSFSIDPVKILDHDDQRLPLTLAQLDAFDHIQNPLAPLTRIESLPLGIAYVDIEQRQDDGNRRLERFVERKQFASNLLANFARVVTTVDLKIGFEQIDGWKIGCSLAV